VKTIIHINQHKIRANIHHNPDKRDKVISVKNYKSNTYCDEVEILGKSKVVYSPDKTLSCGARCWIETEADVIIK
jgi:hypothetical protein